VSYPKDILELGGLAMAHAFHILSEFDDGELLCPFAVIIGPEGREVIDFQGDTQEEAVNAAKGYLAAPDDGVRLVAFARDGRSLTRALQYLDVISVSVRDALSNYECTFSQFYRQTAGDLDFLGDVEFVLGEEADDIALADAHRELIVVGMECHPTAGDKITALRRRSFPLPLMLERSERLQ
jgi:hypothetical protein